ncbi:MAG: CHAT domain-containing tetratricopeptide repeat protein [Pirellulaceae bacterium]
MFSNIHSDVANTLEWIAEQHATLQQFPEALKRRRDAISILKALYGMDDWRVTDATRLLHHTETLSNLSADQRRQLNAAEATLQQAFELYNDSQIKKAIAVNKKGLKVFNEILGPDDPSTLLRQKFLAVLYWDNGETLEAERVFIQVSDAQRKTLGEQHPDFRESQEQLARVYWIQAKALDQVGRHAEAITAAEKTLVIERQLNGETHQRVAGLLDRIAGFEERSGDLKAAVSRYSDSLAIKKTLYGPHDWRVADSKVDLDYAKRLAELTSSERRRLTKATSSSSQIVELYEGGRFREALELAANVRDIRKELLGEKHYYYAESLLNLGAQLKALGDYAAAEPVYSEAADIFKAVVGENHPDYALCLNNLGALYQKQGDYSKVEQVHRKALHIYDRTLGKDSFEYARSANNLASYFFDLGDYAKALALHQEAQEVFFSVSGKDSEDYANGLLNLGTVYCAQGDYKLAELHVRRALSIARRLGEDENFEQLCLKNLAVLYLEQGKYGEAETVLRQASELVVSGFGDDHPEYAFILGAIAAIYEENGDLVRAESLYQEAISIREAAYGTDDLDACLTYANLGCVYLRRGESGKAKEPLLKAINVCKSKLGEEHHLYSTCLTNLAWLYVMEGEHEDADSSFQRAMMIAMDNLDLLSSVQSERQQLAHVAKWRATLDSYLAFTLEAEGYHESAFRYLLNWKGVVTSRQQAIRAVADQPEMEPVFRELQAVSLRLATLAFSIPDSHEVENWRGQVERLTRRKESLEARLSELSVAYVRREVTADSLRAALPDNCALVDFVEIETGIAGKGRRLVAFVLPRQGRVKLLDLAATMDLDEMIEEWREGLGGSKGARQAGARLREMIWQPLEPLLEDAEVVLISPDGALGRLPLGALPGKEPDTFLLEEKILGVIAAPQMLPQLLDTSPADGENPSLLLVGDVDYDAKAGGEGHSLGEELEEGSPVPAFELLAGDVPSAPRDAEDAEGFARLPATREEVGVVRDLFKRRFSDGAGKTLRKLAATEQAFRESAPGCRYLHLATHGFFAAERFRSALDRSPSSRPLPDGLLNRQTISGYNPGLLSGLALAGANQSDTGEDDGILTAEEVQSLDLRGVDLAVLSACETGLGKRAGGEGVLGLQRSFHLAGAKTVVASLWNVDDTATRELMQRFYSNLWERDMGKLEALREAQLWMLRERGRTGLSDSRGLKLLEAEDAGSKRLPPYYWAAFVLSGDWR